MNVLIVIVLFGLMHALRSFNDGGLATGVGTSLALGYLLLTGHFVAKLFVYARLPKLTGYLMTVIVVGPAALGLVTERMLGNLKLVNGMAIALIALTAGVELDLRTMRPLFRSIGWISLTGVAGTALLLGLAVGLLSPSLPFMLGMSIEQRIIVSLVLGIVMVAQSPAVVIALRNELEADGPVSRTVLGTVVIADLIVILLFTLSSSVAKAMWGGPLDLWLTLGTLAAELLGSLAVGALLGYVLAVYVNKVKSGAPLFLLTLAFVIAEVGQRLHFDPLLVALAAGMLVRNATGAGDYVHQQIEASALPIYVLFFAVAGANVHLDVLSVVGIPAVLFVLVRAGGLVSGTRLGARLAGAPEAVQRYAGYGLLPQAGLALALSMLFAKTFPEFGEHAGALTLSVVAINEVVAPAVYRYALVRSGEAGCRRTTHGANAHSDSTSAATRSASA